MRRAVVTGMGCVSGLGRNLCETWSAMLEGRGAIRSVDIAVEGDAAQALSIVVAKVDDKTVLAKLNASFARRRLATVDRFSNMAAAATLEALEQAGLVGADALANAAIVYGNSSGGNAAIEAGYHRLFCDGFTFGDPLLIPRTMSSGAVSHLSMLFGIRGQCMAVSSACASSAHAISESMHLIRSGRAELVVTGGSDASLTYGSLLGWRDLYALSRDACRPFSAGRQGTVLGEGAATLVLESEEHALARGASILAIVAGSASTSDAAHITRPDSDSAARAVSAALDDAGLKASEPMLISSHGTGTVLNDKSEAEALRKVFGEQLFAHRVVATKSAHGHMLGASAAMELVVGIAALQAGVAPPILSYLGPDSDCDLPLVLEPEAISFRTLLSTSFAFGGLNCVLVAQAPN
jgi:nodulation protein E